MYCVKEQTKANKYEFLNRLITCYSITGKSHNTKQTQDEAECVTGFWGRQIDAQAVALVYNSLYLNLWCPVDPRTPSSHGDQAHALLFFMT